MIYTFVFDALSRITIAGIVMAAPSKAVVSMGAVSGALIEFIAVINFWLYSRAARQFGAFHICLERTHRYLLAYKIADNGGDKKQDVFANLVSVMANAPMITHQDIDNVGSGSWWARAKRTSINPLAVEGENGRVTSTVKAS